MVGLKEEEGEERAFWRERDLCPKYRRISFLNTHINVRMKRGEESAKVFKKLPKWEIRRDNPVRSRKKDICMKRGPQLKKKKKTTKKEKKKEYEKGAEASFHSHMNRRSISHVQGAKC